MSPAQPSGFNVIAFIIVCLLPWCRYSPEAKKEASDGEAGADDLQAQEDERRMKFSYAVAEMIAMAPHTKQLLLQVGVERAWQP